MSRQKFTWTAAYALVLAGNLVCFTEANRLKFFSDLELERSANIKSM